MRSNVGNMLQRLGKIGINSKKSVNDLLTCTKTSHVLDPEITSLQIFDTIIYISLYIVD